MRALFLLVVLAVAQVAAHGETDQTMAADFAWFDALGFTDVKDLRFVRYCYGTGFFGDGKKAEQWSEGFLQQESLPKFRVLTFQFDSIEFSRDDHDFEANHRYEPADFRAFAEARLAAARSSEGLGRLDHTIFGPHFEVRTELFVLAWMCERKGLDDLAAKLYAVALTVPGRNPLKDTGWPFRDKLERDIGEFEMWRTILAFDDPKVPRRDLLARLRALAAHFPHCDYLARAEAMAKELERMIEEDATHPPRTAAEIAALSPDEQARECVFRLRDQNGKQWGQPGGVDIFRTREDSPAHQLVKLGDAAVPELIMALEDTRLTRSVGYGRDFYFSHEVLTVGEAALTIIERIAGRQFDRSRGEDLAHAAVREWWPKHQAQGVHDELAETTAKGGFDAATAGAKLLAEFPDDAATAILAGAAAAKDQSERRRFVNLLGKLRDDRVTDFLLREVRTGPFPASRIEAARQLVKLGRMEAIEPMIVEWQRSGPVFEPIQRYDRQSLVAFLAQSDSPEAIHALADGLEERSLGARHQVLVALSLKPSSWYFHGPFEDRPRLGPFSARTQEAMEELLVAEAADTGAYWPIHGLVNSRQIDDPRICEDAAALLAARWPDRYQFDIKATYPVRERARVACLNVWREAHEQPPLPLPLERLPVAPGEELKIADVVFAGDGLDWPPPMISALRDCRGKVFDAPLLATITRRFVEACAGKAPEAKRGFFVDAFRERANDGVTLVVAPVRHAAIARHPDRAWNLDYFAIVNQAEQLGIHSADLFGKNHREADPKKIYAIFDQITGLPATSPFYLRMELAPQAWADDDTY